MHRIYRWAAELAAVCALGSYAALVPRNSNVPQPNAGHAGANAQDKEARLSDEGTREREETRRKMAVFREAVLAAAMSANPQAAPPPTDPVVHATDTLFRHLVNAPPDPQETARMERALEALIASGVLQGTSATFICGSTMCRVELTDREDSKVQTATRAFTENLPKLFGAAVASPNGTSETTLYVAKNSEDLRHSPVPEGDAGLAWAPTAAQ